MIKKRVAVLRGGPSSEYDVSLQTGKSIIDELMHDYDITDIVIDKAGKWHIGGLEQEPKKAVSNVDVVFNAMHGEYGEDGKVQTLLENLQIPFTGAKAFAAALSINKAKTKEMYKQHGIKTPMHKVLSKTDTHGGLEVQATLIFKNFTMPVVIKPNDKGSSVGVSICRTYEDLVNTMTSLYEYCDRIIVEEYIRGKEATVGVVDKMRGQDHYPLFPVEIAKERQDQLFDYESKYYSPLEKKCPGCFNKEEMRELQELAVLAHKILDLRHYSRTDFIVSPRRGIYVLETNALPGLTSESLLPFSLKAHGITYREFLDHILNNI